MTKLNKFVRYKKEISYGKDILTKPEDLGIVVGYGTFTEGMRLAEEHNAIMSTGVVGYYSKSADRRFWILNLRTQQIVPSILDSDYVEIL